VVGATVMFGWDDVGDGGEADTVWQRRGHAGALVEKPFVVPVRNPPLVPVSKPGVPIRD
jgi:hypothetical protein